MVLMGLDVKRWLGELRGKDMADSYSWSYKRKYKAGYVWQDLMEDDLITPVSDNEYVLEGIEIPPSDIKDKKKGIEDQNALSKDGQCQSNHSHSSESSVYMSTKSSEIEEESPPFASDTSTIADDSGKTKPKVNPTSEPECTPPLFSTILSKKSTVKSSNGKTTTTLIDSSELNMTKNTSFSNGSSWIFRNLITCGTVKTNEAALVAMSTHHRKPHFLSLCSNDATDVKSSDLKSRNKFGGTQRSFKIPTWAARINGRKNYDELMDSAKLRSQRSGSATHKLCNWPNCSQCGNTFKPEKLHKHMKSFKGMKVFSTSKAASMAATVSTSQKGTMLFAESSLQCSLLYCSTDLSSKHKFI